MLYKYEVEIIVRKRKGLLGMVTIGEDVVKFNGEFGLLPDFLMAIKNFIKEWIE